MGWTVELLSVGHKLPLDFSGLPGSTTDAHIMSPVTFIAHHCGAALSVHVVLSQAHKAPTCPQNLLTF